MAHAYSLVGKNLKLDTAQDIAPYLEQIRNIEPLHSISLGGNTLGVGACVALADVLREKKTLRQADFADIFTGRLITEIPDALRALCDALVDHPELEEVNLSDNAFGGRSAEPMVNLLTNNHNIAVLRLSNNGLGVTGGTIVANALKAAADKLDGRPSRLHTVVCGRNRLENGSSQAWAAAFAAHGSLREVRMYQNGIRMEGIETICDGLSKSRDLEVLDFQDNTATLRGSRAIAKALPNWPNLRVLNLSDTLLKPKGGAAILAAIGAGHTKKLEALHLQYCDLDRAALHALASAVEEHLSELKTLEINGNWADEDDESVQRICKALEKWGNGDALDELDEMDPDGEDDEDEDEDEGEDENEDDDTADPGADDGKPDDGSADAEAENELASKLAGTHLK
ncbi:Ran GAP Rna1 [Malassezia cuniculi]|uniref:Ran GAP Rna1 n=1 Tax=Malassezia cuniculi TaxID=948313 RepID=A0AAF0JCL9_9BASI|nr:Ran GAP Rna1 [Malassezia cuniculi]